VSKKRIPTLTKQSTLLSLNRGQVLIFHPNLCHSGGNSSKLPLNQNHPLTTIAFQVFGNSMSNEHITDVSMHYSVVNMYMSVGVGIGAASLRDAPELMLVCYADQDDPNFPQKELAYGKLIRDTKLHLQQIIYGTHRNSFLLHQTTMHATNLLNMDDDKSYIFHPIVSAQDMIENLSLKEYSVCRYKWGRRS